jgi:hypothetical protein
MKLGEKQCRLPCPKLKHAGVAFRADLNTAMRSSRLSATTKSKKSRNAREIQVNNSLNEWTIQPFKTWRPSGLKTRLGNHPIGRKVS